MGAFNLIHCGKCANTVSVLSCDATMACRRCGQSDNVQVIARSVCAAEVANMLVEGLRDASEEIHAHIINKVAGMKNESQLNEGSVGMRNTLMTIKQHLGLGPLAGELRRRPFLAKPLSLPKRSAAVSSVVRWDQLSRQPVHNVSLPEQDYGALRKLLGEMTTSFTTQRTVSVDSIGAMHGLRYSRAGSVGETFRALEPIRASSSADIEARRHALATATAGSKITEAAWDGRLMLNSPHPCEAIEQAIIFCRMTGLAMTFSAEVDSISLSPFAAAKLQQDWAAVAVPTDDSEFADILSALQAEHAACAWMRLPFPYAEGCILLLPKAYRSSRRAARTLSKAGMTEITGVIRLNARCRSRYDNIELQHSELSEPAGVAA